MFNKKQQKQQIGISVEVTRNKPLGINIMSILILKCIKRRNKAKLVTD